MLLILLFLAHYIADYTHLSTVWMLNAKKIGKPLFPIFIHALVHSLLMTIIIIFFTDWNILILYLLIIQLLSHFIIDTLKGKMNIWFPSIQNPANKFHWYVFGFDQYLHILVIILMNYLILK